MHPQMNFALGSSGLYIVRDSQEKSAMEWILFTRTISGQFLDYRTSRKEFEWRLYDGVDHLELKHQDKESYFLRCPGEVADRKGDDNEIIHPDYVWMHQEENSGLVLVDFESVNPITFWRFLQSRPLVRKNLGS